MLRRIRDFFSNYSSSSQNRVQSIHIPSPDAKTPVENKPSGEGKAASAQIPPPATPSIPGVPTAPRLHADETLIPRESKKSAAASRISMDAFKPSENSATPPSSERVNDVAASASALPAKAAQPAFFKEKDRRRAHPFSEKHILFSHSNRAVDKYIRNPKNFTDTQFAELAKLFTEQDPSGELLSQIHLDFLDKNAKHLENPIFATKLDNFFNTLKNRCASVVLENPTILKNRTIQVFEKFRTDPSFNNTDLEELVRMYKRRDPSGEILWDTHEEFCNTHKKELEDKDFSNKFDYFFDELQALIEESHNRPRPS